MRKKQIIITSILGFLSFGFFAVFLVGLSFYQNNELKLMVDKINNNFKISFEKNNFASLYQVTVKDENNNVVYETKTNNNEVFADFIKNYNNNYSVSVIALDENGNKISASSIDHINWNTPTINKDKTSSEYYYYIDINGKITNNLKLSYYLENSKITTVNVNDNQSPYPKELFNNREKKIKVILHDGDDKLDEVYIYVKQDAIEKISIINPSSYMEYSVNDLEVSISGGRGSSNIIGYLYKEDELINYVTITNNKAIFKKDILEENVLYKLIVKGTFNDYSNVNSNSNVSFWIVSYDKVNPVYVTHNKYVTKGQKIELLSKSKDATIMYTLDGSIPTKNNGYVYNEAIAIENNTSIKAIAISNINNRVSEITSFEFVPKYKKITIYLSPSNQIHNAGVSEVGYTVEEEMMNKLADILEPILKNRGYVVYRNNPKTDIMTWAAESKKYQADLHLALHSNGSILHDESGVKTYIDEENNLTYSLANIIQEKLVAVYHNKENKNNTISYANGKLGEVRPTLIPFGILLEIGYHDDYNDAFWIVNNMNTIANAIADAIDSYYGY